MCDILRRWGTQTRIKLKIPIFWTKFVQKKYFRLKIEKTELRYWILIIQINLGIKFKLKLTILFWWTKLGKNGVSCVENGESDYHH